MASRRRRAPGPLAAVAAASVLAAVPPAAAQTAPWEAVNRFAVLEAATPAYASRAQPEWYPAWPDDRPFVNGWTETAAAGSAVWVSSCGLDGAPEPSEVCVVHGLRPDAEAWAGPPFVPFVRLYAEVPRAALRLLPPAAPTSRSAAGTGLPPGFASAVGSYGEAEVVGPSVGSLNVRAGPSTDHPVLFEIEGEPGSPPAVHRLACAERRPGDWGEWCLAAVDLEYDPLDYGGSFPSVGFVYTAALVPHVFDGGFEDE